MKKKVFNCPICGLNFVVEVEEEETTTTCSCGQTATATDVDPELLTP